MERAEEGAAVKEEIKVALGGSERDEEGDEESDRCTCKSMRCKLSDTCNHYTQGWPVHVHRTYIFRTPYVYVHRTRASDFVRFLYENGRHSPAGCVFMYFFVFSKSPTCIWVHIGVTRIQLGYGSGIVPILIRYIQIP